MQEGKVKKLLIMPFLFWMSLSASSPSEAMLYSTFIPGGGQVYNGAYAKAGLVIGLQAYLIGTTIHNDSKMDDYRSRAANATDSYNFQYYTNRADEFEEKRTSGIWWIGITAALSMIDAYVDAHLADFEAKREKLHLQFQDDMLTLGYSF